MANLFATFVVTKVEVSLVLFAAKKYKNTVLPFSYAQFMAFSRVFKIIRFMAEDTVNTESADDQVGNVARDLDSQLGCGFVLAISLLGGLSLVIYTSTLL